MSNIKNNLVSKRYADALFNLVKESNLNFNDIFTQLCSIKESLELSQELNDFMVNPIISLEDKKNVITQLLSGKVDGVLINFISLLIDKERFSAFNDIVDSFKSFVDESNNVQCIYVTSAIELNDVIKNRLIEKLSSKLNKNINLITNVDSDIIAGLVIKIDDNIIDMSLKHKFEELSKEMTK